MDKGAMSRFMLNWNFLPFLLAVGMLAAVWAQAENQEGLMADSKMTFLDNGTVRIGMDLNRGGAVTYLSCREHPGNLINSFDLGRQIQMSHYSYPVPFEPDGKKPHKTWTGIGWNPIQTGDHFGNPSVVEEHRNDGKELYIRCIPMHWPLDNVPGECSYETWTTLDGPVVRMRFRFINKRPDKTQYPARMQELPAFYTISTLDRVMSYTRTRPFTGDSVSHVTNDWHKPWPWTSFIATEGWAAMVNSNEWGLGIFKDDGAEFHGGLHGDAGCADPLGAPTTYLAPVHEEMIDHNIVYEYQTEFMVGTLGDMRRYFNGRATRRLPWWTFKTDRQHWSVKGGTDQGYPLDGAWRIQAKGGALSLRSSVCRWLGADAGKVTLDLAWKGATGPWRLYWRTADDRSTSKERSVAFDVVGDGVSRSLSVDLGASPAYRGVIIGLELRPDQDSNPGDLLTVHRIVLSK